jgi:hypothetical protein
VPDLQELRPASLLFAQAARQIGNAARALGLRVPGFRCPPRTPGADRALRRADDSAVVAVRMRGRNFRLVLADMIDGVIAVNRLDGDAANRAREGLWRSVEPDHANAA